MNAENPKNPADIINSPPHYTGENGMEAIDVIEAFDLGFNLGNVVKYVLRAGKKGDRTEDLKKAAWYLNREITKKRFAWQKAAMGGYKILKDRIGIRITTHNPNNFNVGPTTLDGSPYRLGVVYIAEAMARPRAQNPEFFFRLECAIEGDRSVKGVADRTDSSIVPDVIERHIDARDRYNLDFIGRFSQHNDLDERLIETDDREAAQSEAETYRAISESGILEGEIRIPWITAYYKLGDLITELNGRSLGFRTDSGTGDQQAVYPMVERIRWTFSPEVGTFLRLSDESQARHQIERKLRKNQQGRRLGPGRGQGWGQD